MTWVDSVVDWLATTGIKVAIILIITTGLFLVWRVVCRLLVKGLVTSTIKAREAVMRSKYKMGKSARSSTAAFSNVSNKIMHKISDKSVDAENDSSNNNINTDHDDVKSIENDDNDDNETEIEVKFSSIKLSDEIRQAMEERANTIGGVIRGVGNFAIVIVTCIQLLDAVGVSTTPLLTVAALFGFALALAAEDIVSDFIGGAFILAENQYFHGETVSINGYTGTVEDFTLRVTKLRAKNGDLRIIPNGEIREVTNKSRVFSLAVVTVTVPYGVESDYEMAEECLSDIIVPQLKEDESLEKILFNSNITVKAYDLLEESIKIRMAVKVRTGFTDTVQQKMMKLVRTEFPNKNITISSLECGVKAQNPDDDEEDESDDDGPF